MQKIEDLANKELKNDIQDSPDKHKSNSLDLSPSPKSAKDFDS